MPFDALFCSTEELLLLAFICKSLSYILTLRKLHTKHICLHYMQINRFMSFS